MMCKKVYEKIYINNIPIRKFQNKSGKPFFSLLDICDLLNIKSYELAASWTHADRRETVIIENKKVTMISFEAVQKLIQRSKMNDAHMLFQLFGNEAFYEPYRKVGVEA